MWNLLISAHPTAWENNKTCRIDARRFCEYSSDAAQSLSLKNSDTLRTLESLPTLLVYESAIDSKNAHLVRHGTISNLHRDGRDLVFQFTPDSERGYFLRGLLQKFSGELGIHRFEHYRTHWAVKEGDIPSGLLAQADPKPPARNVPLVYAAYREAVFAGENQQCSALTAELASFPPSEEKAIEYLRTGMEDEVYLPAHALLGLRPKSPEARAVLESLQDAALLVVDPYPEIGHGSHPFLIAPFYATFGAPTEHSRLDEAIEDCTAIVSELESNYRTKQEGLRSIAYVLWQAGRQAVLAERLRRRLNDLVDRIMQDRTSACLWNDKQGDADLLATAMVTVGMQRLGDDKHRTALGQTIESLCEQQKEDGSLPAVSGDRYGDVLTTVLAIEGVQRSGYSESLSHVIERGEAWIMQQQRPTGQWGSEGWNSLSVTTSVLDYFEHRSTMLPQVDGFFLMARDFFKKAIDLRVEGGANNRRLAAIAAVHALEMFLYGLFDASPGLGVSAYRDKGDETLGPREAIRALQEALQRSGDLGERQGLSYRDQISSLIRERDNIIHHASEITDEELSRGLTAVGAFIRRYGADLIQLDLLQ